MILSSSHVVGLVVPVVVNVLRGTVNLEFVEFEP